MSYFAKPKPDAIYGALIRLYPESFRKHYGSTMVQTFSDMLESEHNRAGRWLIWLRALLDLPISAAKEHLTDGKDFMMNRMTKFILAGAAVLLVVVGLSSFWFGKLHAVQAVGIERVTLAQLADAMQQDHFYSDYDEAALLFSGKVLTSQSANQATLVTFATNRPYSVTCQFPSNLSVKSGQNLSVAAPGGSAERQKHGVLLHDCVVN